MYKLYFENNKGNRLLIGDCADLGEVNTQIDYFLKERNFKAPYYRHWTEDKETFIDVGSHYEMFVAVYENKK